MICERCFVKLPNIFEKEARPEIYPAGSVIFEEGQSGDSMYIVRKGEVELRVKDRTVACVLVNEFFGEMALVEKGQRNASAIAKTACTLIPVNQKQFIFMVEETPFFALEIMRVMSGRLRRQDAMV